MAEGRFRLDLYYRLNTFPVTLPPLRERKEDIKPLSYFITEKFSKRYGKTVERISEQMLSQLEEYNWPGNIRELENILEQALILQNGGSELTLNPMLSEKIRRKNNPIESIYTDATAKTFDDIKQIQRQVQIEHISSVLEKTGGRIRGKDGAAELLNEKPTTLESKMAKLGIKKESFFK